MRPPLSLDYFCRLSDTSCSPCRDDAFGSVVHMAARAATVGRGEQGGSGRVHYYFTGAAITESDDPLERDILDSIRRNNTGLQLYKTKGHYYHAFHSVETHVVYRLKSEQHHACFDFDLWPQGGGGLLCHVLIVFMSPEFQGNFFRFRDFLIERVAKTLFDLTRVRIALLEGRAMQNQYAIRPKSTRGADWRNQKTRDGTTKLIRLYERLGFVRLRRSSDTVILLSEQTRREFADSGSSSEQLLASQQGKMARNRVGLRSARLNLPPPQ